MSHHQGYPEIYERYIAMTRYALNFCRTLKEFSAVETINFNGINVACSSLSYYYQPFDVFAMWAKHDVPH